MSIGRAVRSWAPVVVGLALLVFGIACFNYTKPGTLEHHQQWANEHARPAPSNAILWSGVGSVVIGAFAAGFGIGGRQRNAA